MKKLGFDLIILGDSTAGKDTQALIFSKKYNVRLARSGEYLRKFKPKEYVQGGPAPTKLILPFLNHSLKNLGNKNLIFVGAARLKPEAQYLVKLLKKNKHDFFVIYIKLPKAEIIKRSTRRASRLEDINLNLINGRIRYFKELVSKTTHFYKTLNKIKFINGKQTIKQVSSDIQNAINDYQQSQRNRTA